MVFLQMKKLKDINEILLKIKDLFKKNFSKITLSLILPLLALSATANFNRISSKDSKLDNLYKYSIDYLINLERKELLFDSKNEKNVSTKQVEIEINISNDFYHALIVDSIDKDNKYSEDFKKLLITVRKYHELEMKKLTVSYANGAQKENEDEFNKKNIEENEEKYKRIEAQQKELIEKLTKELPKELIEELTKELTEELPKDESINLQNAYKLIVMKYYLEEKAINRFKLFYFF